MAHPDQHLIYPDGAFCEGDPKLIGERLMSVGVFLSLVAGLVVFFSLEASSLLASSRFWRVLGVMAKAPNLSLLAPPMALIAAVAESAAS